MHAIMTVIYTIIKYFCEYYKTEGIKGFFKKIWQGIYISIIGILMASVILFPTIYAFINSTRTESTGIGTFASMHYINIFTINLLTFYSDFHCNTIGIASIILSMIPIFLKNRKENKTYFIYWIVTSIFLLVPFLSSMMNGFGFINNRWTFVYVFILSYIITLSLKKEYNKNEIKTASIFLSIYLLFIISIALKSNIKNTVTCLVQTGIAFIILYIMQMSIQINREKFLKYFSEKEIKFCEKYGKNILTFIMVIFSIHIISYDFFTPYNQNALKDYIALGEVEKYISTQKGENESFSQNIKNILSNDQNFYRIGKMPHTIQNSSIYYKYLGLETFISLGNNYVYNLNRELLDNFARTVESIRGFGDRTKITTLVGTKYYIADENSSSRIPYGYEFVEKIGNVGTYKNKYPLSLGVAYTQYMLRDDYEKLSPLEKEDALTKVAVIDNKEIIRKL